VAGEAVSRRLPDIGCATLASSVLQGPGCNRDAGGELHCAHGVIPAAILLLFAGKADSVIGTSKGASAAPANKPQIAKDHFCGVAYERPLVIDCRSMNPQHLSSIGGVLADDSSNKPVSKVLFPEPATGRPMEWLGWPLA